MKNLKLFKTEAEYVAAYNAGLPVPSVSYVKNGAIHYLGATHAGDIAYWNGSYVEFCAPGSWASSLGTPVGVVVVPNTHRDDSKTIVMSLVNMSCKTPETGTLIAAPVANDNYMVWGDKTTNLSLTDYPNVQTIDIAGGTTTGVANYAYLPSDSFFNFSGGYKANSGATADDKAVYRADISSYLPSPYLKDGSKNPQYFTAGYALSDFNGKANQAVIKASMTAGLTGEVPNSSEVGNYPPVACCSRFKTVGTNAGDWYLPSSGELGYLAVRLNAINKSLEMLGSDVAVKVGDWADYGTYGSWCWASTEYSTTYARYQNTSIGNVDYNDKDYTSTYNRVRAFCAF